MSLRQDPPKPHASFCIQLVGTFAILLTEYVLLLSLAALSLAPLRAPLPFSPACPEVFAKGHKPPFTSYTKAPRRVELGRTTNGRSHAFRKTRSARRPLPGNDPGTLHSRGRH